MIIFFQFLNIVIFGGAALLIQASLAYRLSSCKDGDSQFLGVMGLTISALLTLLIIALSMQHLITS